MTTAIYLVIFSRESWWVDLDGESDGPFGTLDAAIGQAVESAKSTARRGGRSEVRVMGPGRDNAMIYQSPERSILSRAVAMAHHNPVGA
jgi:hypothetical protein